MAQSSDQSLDVFKQASAFPSQHAGAVVRLALIPLLLAIGLTYAVFWLYGAAIWQLEPFGLRDWPAGLRVAGLMVRELAGLLLAASPFILAATTIAVGVQRLILVGENPGWVIFRFRTYERAYLLAVLLTLGLLIAAFVALSAFALVAPTAWATKAPGAGLAALLGIPTVAFVAASLYVLGRLKLLGPHAAVTGRVAPAASWAAMRGNIGRALSARLAFARPATLVFIVLALAALALLALAGPAGEPGRAALFVVAGLVAMLFLYVLSSALNAYIYKDLIAAGTEPRAAGTSP